MKRISLVSLGPVDEGFLEAVHHSLERGFGIQTQRMTPLPQPSYAFDPLRRQYSSTLMLRDLLDRIPDGSLRLLALTEYDLFIPMLSFIFGQAQVPGKVAIVSLARLRQEFYGLAANRELLTSRVVKEATHELGHTFGLVHCREAGCPMSLSTTIRQVDAKGDVFCPGCTRLLDESMAK